jgi:hypothetical protein
MPASYQTPYISTPRVVAVSLMVGRIFSERLDDLNRIVNIGALTGFPLLHASVVNHYMPRQASGPWIRHWVFPVAGCLVIACVVYERDTAAKILGTFRIGVGALDYLALTFARRKPATLKI